MSSLETTAPTISDQSHDHLSLFFKEAQVTPQRKKPYQLKWETIVQPSPIPVNDLERAF